MKKEKIQQKIDIILVTFKRLDLLKLATRFLYERTKYPYRLLVVNNGKDDVDTIKYLTSAKNCGYLHDFISIDNKGLANGLSEGFKYLENSKGGISEYVITSQDDIIVPLLRPICWLERLMNLFEKYEDEYGAIAMRTQRIRRRDVNEEKELIDSPTSLASFNRIQRSDDIQKLGNYFTSRPHWESPEIAKSMKKLKKKLAVATHLYVNDIGFMPKNKGFEEDFTEYNTFSPERINQGELQPYPDIHKETCIPLKVNNPRDLPEHKRREAFFQLYGFDMESLIMAEKIMKYKKEKGNIDKINKILNI